MTERTKRHIHVEWEREHDLTDVFARTFIDPERKPLRAVAFFSDGLYSARVEGETYMSDGSLMIGGIRVGGAGGPEMALDSIFATVAVSDE